MWNDIHHSRFSLLPLYLRWEKPFSVCGALVAPFGKKEDNTVTTIIVSKGILVSSCKPWSTHWEVEGETRMGGGNGVESAV